MLNRIKEILTHSTNETDTEIKKLDLVIEELTTSIQLIKDQYHKLSTQESEISDKLQAYSLEHSEKLKNAKQALSHKDEFTAENHYKESEILHHQINQYKKIISNIQATKRKLLAQENQFLLTKDKLLSKKVLGEARVDATQLKAEVSEQLMFLNESDELTKFDELIEEASSKSQAIDEIQGEQSLFDTYIEKQSSPLNDLQEIIDLEKEVKMQTSLRNQQILIERVFGKISPAPDQTQKENQKTLLNRLKQENPSQEAEDRIKSFFKPSVKDSIPESKPQCYVNDKEDRIKNFFQ